MMRSKLVEKIVETEKSHTDSLKSTESVYTNTDFTNHTDILACAKRIYSFLNPVSYLEAMKHQELFCQMDGLFADGAMLVAAIRLVYGVKVHRRSFDMTSLAPVILMNAVEHGRSVYLVGAMQEEVERAVITFREWYKGINIIGYRNGYFNNEAEMNVEACHIAEMQPDLLIVGMGVVRQEKFLLKVKEAGFQGVGFTCGGFIHQVSASVLDYYPKWIDRMGLRFFYRMCKEPHTRKRYIKAGLVFPLKFVKERWKM